MTDVRKPRHRSAGKSLGREVRQFSADGLEVRSGAGGSDTIEVFGKPIVYNTPYSVRDSLGEFEETMKPGVATDVLASGDCDCRFLFNHGGLPMARTTSGTLVLEDSATDLTFVAQLSARQQLSNDLAVAIERGDVNQMSCAFTVSKDTWSTDWMFRDVEAFGSLVDVSAVTYPASPTTEIGKRMLEAIERDMDPESVVRMRKTFFLASDLRAGKVLSNDNAGHVASLLTALQSALDHTTAVADSAGIPTTNGEGADAGGAEQDDVGGSDGTTGGSGPGTGPAGSSLNGDGSGSRTKPPVWTGRSLMERTAE